MTHLQAGPEIGVASTKAYTSQYVALVMIALQLSDDSISKDARRLQIIDGLHDIPDQIRKVLSMDKFLQQMAKDMLSHEKSLLIMGRGYQCLSSFIHHAAGLTIDATCLEGALKIKEVSYMHSEGVSHNQIRSNRADATDLGGRAEAWSPCAGGRASSVSCLVSRLRVGADMQGHLHHDEGFAVSQSSVCSGASHCTQGSSEWVAFVLNGTQLTSVIICNEDDDSVPQSAKVIRVPRTVDCLQGLINVIPLQLLSYRAWHPLRAQGVLLTHRPGGDEWRRRGLPPQSRQVGDNGVAWLFHRDPDRRLDSSRE